MRPGRFLARPRPFSLRLGSLRAHSGRPGHPGRARGRPKSAENCLRLFNKRLGAVWEGSAALPPLSGFLDRFLGGFLGRFLVRFLARFLGCFLAAYGFEEI